MNRVARTTIVAAFISCLWLFSAAQAQAGFYEFKDCDSTWRGEITVESPPYASPPVTNRCLLNDFIVVGSPGMTIGEQTSLQYRLSTGMGFVGWKFWTEVGYTPGISSGYFVNNADGSNSSALSSPSTSAPYPPSWLADSSGYETTSIPRQILRATMTCIQATCSTSPNGRGIGFYKVGLRIEDYTKPESYAGGTLFNAGTVSGTRSAVVTGLDAQSGVRDVFVLVNLQNAGASHTFNCAAQYSKLRPCAAVASRTFNLNTAQPPFVNGTNYVSACTRDYAETGTANTTCENKTITVNN